MRYLLDTNIISDLVRNPQGRIAQRIVTLAKEKSAPVFVAAELRFAAAKSRSVRLSRQLEKILEVLDVLPFETPMDVVYGRLRSRLERNGEPIGGNDLLIAAQTLSLGYTLVTANQQEFSRIGELFRIGFDERIKLARSSSSSWRNGHDDTDRKDRTENWSSRLCAQGGDDLGRNPRLSP